jgi:hypothetical protein
VAYVDVLNAMMCPQGAAYKQTLPAGNLGSYFVMACPPVVPESGVAFHTCVSHASDLDCACIEQC